MKRLLAIAAVAAMATTNARAETVYIGDVFLDFVSGGATCTDDFAVKDFARVIFRPKGGGNGANSSLAYVSTRSSFVMLVQNNTFQANVNYVGSGVGGTGGLISDAGGITVWNQSPRNTGTGAPSVDIQGRFANFFGLSGCFVGFNGNLILR